MQQKNGATVQQNAQAEQLALIQDELRSARILYEKGYVPKTRILLLERQAAALSGEGGEYSSSGASIEQAIGKAQLQMLQLRKERLSEVSLDLSDVQDKLNAMQERLSAGEDVPARTIITAPTSGIVLGMRANTVGGVIDRGAQILEIVPSDEQLVIRAAVRPEDIAEIQVGMPTEVRLDGLRPAPNRHSAWRDPGGIGGPYRHAKRPYRAFRNQGRHHRRSIVDAGYRGGARYAGDGAHSHQTAHRSRVHRRAR